MTLRERMLAVYHGKELTHILWAAYGILLPRGEIERRLRHFGCVSILGCPIYRSETRNIEMSIKELGEDKEKVKICTYHTLLGDVSEIFKDDPSYHTSIWIKKFPISSLADYVL